MKSRLLYFGDISKTGGPLITVLYVSESCSCLLASIHFRKVFPSLNKVVLPKVPLKIDDRSHCLSPVIVISSAASGEWTSKSMLWRSDRLKSQNHEW
eukprot:4752359-Amphidinium_carterae.1